MSFEDFEVQKRNGRTELFSREKLRRSIVKATHKSLLPTEADIDAYLQRVLNILRPPIHGQPLASADIGHLVLRAMEGDDPGSIVTRIRYAIVFIGSRRGGSGFSNARDFLGWLAQNYAKPATLPTGTTMPYRVVKRDNSVQEFDSKKVERSVGIAAKGQGSRIEVHDLATSVANEATHELNTQALVTSQQVAAEVLKVLRRRNGVAYLRYASAVKRYQSSDDFWLDAESLEAPAGHKSRAET